MYCTFCAINWAKPDTIYDEVGEEQADVCPQCKSDWHLEEKHEGPEYVYCKISGVIMDSKTKEIKPYMPSVQLPAMKPHRSFDPKKWEERKAVLEAKEERAIDAYQEEFAKSGSNESAAAAYKAVITAKYDAEVGATIIQQA